MREKEFLPLVYGKLGIEKLNEMQRRMLDECTAHHNIVLLSPTGTGKTLAFILPMLKLIKGSTGRVQALVIAPGRELVVQICSIFREVAAGLKVTPLYGGHKVEDETNSLSVTPDIVVATPGRLLDHAKRRNIDLRDVRILVLDEFDKTLELGFEGEMKEIMRKLKNVSRIIFTSATRLDSLPDFIDIDSPLEIDYLQKENSVRERQHVHQVNSSEADKLESLHSLLSHLAEGDNIGRTIIFVNYRESAERVYNWLRQHGVHCGIYHGQLDQHDREKAISMFNNGSTPILVATDLAARGLDIERIKHIIHYHQPVTQETYTHRNGRTARAGAAGDIYVLIGPKETLKEYIKPDDILEIAPHATTDIKASTATLHFNAGKKEKISRGDVAGFLIKEGGLQPDEVGKIDVADHYALAAIPADKAKTVMKNIEGKKIKGKKLKISLA